MKKLILTPEEQEAMREAWAERLPEDTPINKFAEQKILSTGTPEQINRFYSLLIMKHNAEQKTWRQWFIESGLIKWIIECEAEKGLKDLSKRLKAEWGDLVEMYNLNDHFNKSYQDVISKYK